MHAAVATTSVAAATAGAASGGASGAASGIGGGVSGGVTDVTAVLMAVQRMAVLSSMPVDKSQLHAKVCGLGHTLEVRSPLN